MTLPAVLIAIAILAWATGIGLDIFSDLDQAWEPTTRSWAMLLTLMAIASTLILQETP